MTPKTIGYIHSLICDSITLFHSDACNAKALRNESMILEVLEAKEPAVFRQQLFNTLVHYYEEILGMPGAGGRPKPQSFKRKMRDDEPQPAAAAAVAEGDSAEAAADGPPAPPLQVVGGVKPKRQQQQPPPLGRRQEGVGKVVPGPRH